MIKLKSLLQRILPEQVLVPLAGIKGIVKVAGAKIAFRMNRSTRGSLPAEMIGVLSRDYVEPPKVRYDPDGLVFRARENVARMNPWIVLDKVRSALELGCWDGMVSAQLKDQVDQCWALDLSRKGFDPRAGDRGVWRVQGDAGHLPFARGAFDLVFSFAAFEHFPEPVRVLRETARILRPGGFFYLEFGPIGTAPYGLHAYREIPVPYLQILFNGEELRRYAREKGWSADWPFINGLGLRDYRGMLEAAKRNPIMRMRFDGNLLRLGATFRHGCWARRRTKKYAA